ncbi:hypothetical protein [Psychromonas sp. Urea-02u-13]|uniref:hypothetical protein n=1 Tax=Psychromonas sp. Urea-02u-13 TaxID=2058326 RepID=UPI000C33DC87|nr:hypothetical protein [Psychromonas sp. Urea-02u-13]PKG40781.1 hypothetical protein CXF74_01190 [Psychromonas sp. Urea-02u-13]
MLIKGKQQGFVLISVLLITSISTFFAFSAIDENRLQECIAGNQIKELNARSEAEKGIFASYSYTQAKQALTPPTPIADIILALDGKTVPGEYTLTAKVGATANSLLITSKGIHQGAVAYLKAEIEVGVTSSGGEYDAAIVSCEGVVMGAGGVVDSFDSRKGSYEKQFKDKYGKDYSLPTQNAPATPDEYVNANANANVSTTYDAIQGAKGDISQTGKAPIYGNVNATGNYTGNGSKVVGDIKTNGNVGFTTKEAIPTGSGFR